MAEFDFPERIYVHSDEDGEDDKPVLLTERTVDECGDIGEVVPFAEYRRVAIGKVSAHFVTEMLSDS